MAYGNQDNENRESTDTTEIFSLLSSDFERVDTIDLELGDDPISSVIDKINGFIYFGSGDYPARITKVGLNPLARIGAIDLDPGEDYLWIGLIDNKRGFIYFATYNIPSKIIKIKLSDFTRVGDLVTSLNHITTGIIDEEHGSAYFADIDTGSVIKIDLETFSEIGKVQTSASNGIWSSDIDIGNEHGYFGSALTNLNVSDIVKIDLSNMTEIAKLTLPIEESSPSQIYIDISKGYGYFANYYNFPNTNKVTKVKLSDLTRDSSIDGAIGGTFGGIIDTMRGFLYLGGNGNPTENISGSMIKIDLSTFKKINIINLNSGEIYPDTGVIDEINGYTYFGIYPYPPNSPKVIKIRIAPMSCVWKCERPLDGYETDGCGNRRKNSLCSPSVQAGFGGIGMFLIAGLAVGYILSSKRKDENVLINK